ncbi:MAG: sigma-54-dependent Fis family transcriptional regulator [Desulfuromonadales bacterium]|nr:sigma-54-dependent Fis family transcriptional regulator [Desulfuromonadales bacterium]
MKKTRILVVDDERSMREMLSILLEREGYEAVEAKNADEALRFFETSLFDLVITDIQMPGINGIELLARLKKLSPEIPVLMITAFATAEQAVDAIKLGAFHYFTKPFNNDEIRALVRNALEKSDLKQENILLKQDAQARDGFCGIIGKSPKMRELFAMLQKVAGSLSSILILGESGTGKELAARAIHTSSARRSTPFVAVNCGAIPETLIESELFGHKKGAFTGAVSDRPGLFEQAEGGTLFLDEIGELPLLLQTKLLRVLQEREFRRVGDSVVRKTDVRVLTASNRDLQEQVLAGGFREDLYYRINVVQIIMPPLRDRIEDIPLLVEYFFRKFCDREHSGEIITPAALKLLMNHPFPGNIRELENVVERSLILDRTIISESSLPEQLRAGRTILCPGGEAHIPDEGMQLEPLLEDLEKKYLLKALEKTGGAKKKAADLLGMSFRSFRYRLGKFGLDSGDE